MKETLEGDHLTQPLCAKAKSLTILFILASASLTLLLLPKARAETKIILMTPSLGNIGTTIQLQGNITTENGQYQVQFDEVEVATGAAVGHEVNVSFVVRSTFGGSHNVTIVDVEAEESDKRSFTVLTSYSLQTDVPELEQLQEDGNVTVSFNITGAEASKTFAANFTVQVPNNASYTSLLNVTTTSDGNGNGTIIYPEQFPEAHTNLTGNYKVFLNGTLATGNFTVGLTKYVEYHRLELVDIRASGYRPRENVTLTISLGDETVYSPDDNVTATEGGIVAADWVVPINASIGTYTINVTSVSQDPTLKDVPDVQDFVVPGFDINITARNLAGEPVENVEVEAFERGELVDEATTSTEGLVVLKLEVGNYTCEAAYRNETVGLRNVTVTEKDSFDLSCSLTNLRVLVEDEAANRIPEIQLHLMQESEILFEDATDIDGIAVAHSLLPYVSYVLNASRYGQYFNLTTISMLPSIDWFDLPIFCPTLTMRVNVTGVDDEPIENATVKAQELMGGLRYEGKTVGGVATLNCTFGRYEVEVYASGIRLNGTVIDMFEDQSLLIDCKYYGLTVYVKVVDYLGQPIPNVNVTLQRTGLRLLSNRTVWNGVAAFSDFVGGDVAITIYMNNQKESRVERALITDSSSTISIKMDKYVLVGGFLIEVSQLATALIVAAAVIVILSLEIYRRKHVKS